MVEQYLALGLDPSKTALGIPGYGYSFRLCDPSNMRPGAPTCGPGDEGPVSQQPGTMFYNEVRKQCCTLISEA